MDYSEDTVDAWRRWILIAWAVTGTAFAVILTVTLRQPSSPLVSSTPDHVSPTVALVGQAAPDFRLRSFAGGILTLGDFRGQPIALNFWASWCIPCREEMPVLERVWREFRDRGIMTVGINVDDDYDDAAAFLKRLNISYPNVYDPDQSRIRAYRVRGLPTTVFLDAHLRIRAQEAGGYVQASGYQQLRAQVQALVDQVQSPIKTP